MKEASKSHTPRYFRRVHPLRVKGLLVDRQRVTPFPACLDTVEQRIVNINDYFTFSLYSNVCRSLFEKHKLMFAFLVCARIMMNDNNIDMVREPSIRPPSGQPVCF